MKLPISFEEVPYFNNEYRGDLIITKGVIYYFPHTRVVAARFSHEIGGKDTAEMIGLLGNLVPIIETVPWIHSAADKSVKIGKFLKRTFKPTTNSPKIKKLNLWRGDESNENLQMILDEYISQIKKESLKFEEDSVPQPMRFALEDVENLSFGLKFRFDGKFDNHDFRVNIIHRSQFKKALIEAGFLK